MTTMTEYCVATLVILAVGLCRILFIPDSIPWLLFIPATIGVSFVTGRRAGLFAAFLAVATGVLSIGDPANPMWLPRSQWIAAGLVLLVMLGLVELVTALRDSVRRARRLNADLLERERQAVNREAFLAGVLAASTDCIKVLELDGTLAFMSDGGQDVMEIPDFEAVRGNPWPGFLKDEAAVLASKAVEAARDGRSTCFEATADTFAGTAKWWSISVSPIRGADGRVERILSVSRDITALHQSREQQELLNGELAHRLKNTLSVIQAIARQTLGRTASDDAMTAFSERLVALGRAHDVLTRQQWTAAAMEEVADSVLSAFDRKRFDVHGPNVTIGARAALALSLLLHELATNATKHGSLSAGDGRVELVWRLNDEAGDRVLRMMWCERGGPPAQAPSRKGFGSRIIRMGLTGSGGTTADYDAEGLTLKIEAPLSQLQQP